jgi:hypothetical protein
MIVVSGGSALRSVCSVRSASLNGPKTNESARNLPGIFLEQKLL